MTPVRVSLGPDGSPDPQWSIRDEEEGFRALQLCRLPAVNIPEAREILLTCIAGRMRLPLAEHAMPIEVPDASWQGWDWPSGDSILMQVERDPLLPRLSRMVVPGEGWCRLAIADSPMGVRRISPEDPAWRGKCYAAEIFGFIDETARFWGQVRSQTEAGRDELLAALCTIHVSDPY